MRGLALSSVAALSLALLLAALSLVAWRQSRALEALAAFDEVRRDRAVTQAERVELHRRVQRLESRSRIVPAARERLGMRMPDASEIVILAGEDR